MSSRLHRMWLLPFLLLAAEAWSLGLGDIRLSSALNQPLRAEIELLAATPEELTNLRIQLASAETFDRYDLDRPLFLTRIDFEVVSSGRADGNFIRVTSSEPISEPFVTFLVEASWTRGRLLREYTLLLDPPTFVPPPATQSTQAVTAPSRATPADSGQIQRPAPAAAPQAAPQASRPAVQAPVQTQQPATTPAAEPAPQNSGQTLGQPNFDASPGGDVVVQRGDTLWGITNRVRPDSRLTINQTMLAIYEANPEAFAGNINVLRAGATLRIPSADDVFRINRGDAFAEVRRQNEAWSGETPASAPSPAPAPAPVETVDTQPSLTLVPPDEEDDLGVIDDEPENAVAADADIVDADADPVESRINEIQAILEDQNALIEIPDNELAALRAELAELRGETPLVDPTEDLVVDEADVDQVEAPVDAQPEAAEPVAPAVVSSPTREQGLLDTILGYFTNFFVIIGAALVAAVLLLVWFMRRASNRDDEEATGVWDALDADEYDPESKASTERLQALARDDEESIVVVETQQVDNSEFMGDTLETPVAEAPDPVVPEQPEPEAPPLVAVENDAAAATGTNKSLEDTFSSETAINLDQSDPIAEADFHMAYGLYDQAADLINGAVTAEPERQDLLAKLCEIYFVWGNRDAFIDAATRMKAVVGGGENPDWDKTVIMGQQIAGDHELFTGVSAEGATKAVDLSFDDGDGDGGALDIDFAGDADNAGSDIIDLGADTGQVSIAQNEASAIDFSFDEEEPDLDVSVTREMPTAETGDETVDAAYDEGTAEMPAAAPAADDAASTVETPTIEQQFAMEATGTMQSIDETDVEAAIPESDATAEINLDDLGLDLGGLDETVAATDVADDDLINDLDDTAESQALDVAQELEETGKNPAVDIDSLVATGTSEVLSDLDATGTELEVNRDSEQTGIQQAITEDETLSAIGEMPSLTEATGMMPALGDDDATMLASLDDDAEDTDVGIDTNLLDATGQTQILPGDMAVETGVNKALDIADNDATMLASSNDDTNGASAIPDDAATLLAPLDDDGEFDFAKTEALPKDVFSSDMSSDETGRMPAMTGETDLDLDLDDLTAALKVSEVGDTVNQLRDDATVEQPRISASDASSETGVTQALAPEDLSGDLHEARTMTEVGTKLDLARAYVDMGDPSGARSILEEVLDEGDAGQKQQAQQLLDSLPS